MNSILKASGLILILASLVQAQLRINVASPLPKGELPEAKTLVTLHLKDTPPQQAMEELNKLSTIQFTVQTPQFFQQGGNRTVTIDADKQPFWTVTLNVLNQMQMRIEPNYNDGTGRVQLFPNGNTPDVPQLVSGPALIRLSNATRVHSIQYTAPTSVSNNFNVQMIVYLDPQLTMLGTPERIEVTEATDENGKSLAPKEPFEPRWNMYNNNGNSWIMEAAAPLQYFVEEGKMLKVLKGNIHLQIPAKVDVWEIAEIGKAIGATRDFPGGKYTIASLAQQGGGYQLQINIDSDPARVGLRNQQNPYTDANLIRSALHVTDAMGRDLRANGWGSSGRSQNNLTVNFNYGLNGDVNDVNSLPAAIVWNIPLDIQDVAVPFEFKDLPIP